MAEPELGGTGPCCREESEGTYWWCSCGRSKNQPFCDGSHAGTAFSPLEVTLETGGAQAWCCCKRTRTPPFCDGSHAGLEP